MQYLYSGLLLLLFLSACSPSKKLTRLYGEDLFAHWKHAFEEDQQGIKVYRSANYAFPPSRGRDGFEMYKDGRLLHHSIGANDRPKTMEGRWKLKGKNQLIFLVDGQERHFEIIDKDQNRLSLRPNS